MESCTSGVIPIWSPPSSGQERCGAQGRVTPLTVLVHDGCVFRLEEAVTAPDTRRCKELTAAWLPASSDVISEGRKYAMLLLFGSGDLLWLQVRVIIV